VSTVSTPVKRVRRAPWFLQLRGSRCVRDTLIAHSMLIMLESGLNCSHARAGCLQLHSLPKSCTKSDFALKQDLQNNDMRDSVSAVSNQERGSKGRPGGDLWHVPVVFFRATKWHLCHQIAKDTNRCSADDCSAFTQDKHSERTCTASRHTVASAREYARTIIPAILLDRICILMRAPLCL
jgi:hypothetical protein